LSHARHLIALRKVAIIGTNISVEGLKELRRCESLQELCLYGTKLTSDDVAKLRRMLPDQIVIDYRKGALLGVGSTTDGTAPAVVRSVEPGSAAAAAGIQVGDVIQKFNGEAVANFKALTLKIGDHHAGDEVALEVLRGTQPMEFKVKLGQWKTVE
jgi:predicted metalloprotease with PDZ domain